MKVVSVVLGVMNKCCARVGDRYVCRLRVAEESQKPWVRQILSLQPEYACVEIMLCG